MLMMKKIVQIVLRVAAVAYWAKTTRIVAAAKIYVACVPVSEYVRCDR